MRNKKIRVVSAVHKNERQSLAGISQISKMNSVEKQALVAMIFEKHKETDVYCKLRAEKAEKV
jgi:hypothetical protein